MPIELLRLTHAAAHYLNCARDAMPTIAAMGDDAAFVRDQVSATQLQTEWGTGAAVYMALNDLLDGKPEAGETDDGA
jgi:hypothetical protein